MARALSRFMTPPLDKSPNPLLEPRILFIVAHSHAGRELTSKEMTIVNRWIKTIRITKFGELCKTAPVHQFLILEYIKKYGKWDSISYTFTNQFYLLVNAIQKANSLDRDEVMKAVEKLKFNTLMGQVIMVKRPDIGVHRYCSGVITLDIGEIKNGQLVWKASFPQEKVLKGLPLRYGHEGQWGW